MSCNRLSGSSVILFSIILKEAVAVLTFTLAEVAAVTVIVSSTVASEVTDRSPVLSMVTPLASDTDQTTLSAPRPVAVSGIVSFCLMPVRSPGTAIARSPSGVAVGLSDGLFAGVLVGLIDGFVDGDGFVECFSELSVTLILQTAFAPCPSADVTVILAFPAFFAVTAPFLFTVAIFLFDVNQLNFLIVGFWGEVMVAFSWAVRLFPFTERERADLFRDIFLTFFSFFTTVTVIVAVTFLLFLGRMVIFAFPTFFALIVPFLETAAIFFLLLL